MTTFMVLGLASILFFSSTEFSGIVVKATLSVITVCRYSRHDKRSKLPGWILSHLHDAHLNLSTDMALHIAREVCSCSQLWFEVCVFTCI